MSDEYFSKNIGFNYTIYDVVNIVPDHIHDYYEFFIVLSGKAIHTINGETQILYPRSLYLIRPQDYHSFKSISNESFRLINIMFSAKAIEEYSQFLNNPGFWKDFIEKTLYRPVTITQPEVDELLRNLNMIIDMQKNALNSNYLNHSILSYLLYKFLFSNELSPADCFPKWLNNVLLEMKQKENFIEGMPAIIRISNKSHEYICRAFSKYLHYSPIDYINYLRLKYAEFILINTSFTILDISYACGFNSVSHFNHKFKSLYGCTPSNFRKENKI